MKLTRLVLPLVVTALMLTAISASAQTVKVINEGTRTSLRGLSVVDDKVAWVSGSKGYVAITADGGATWNWQQVKGHEQAEFRDIEAFSSKEAIMIASGTPALILKTVDGGTTWTETFRNNDEAYFLDAMDFSDSKHGWVLGDPINGKFLLLETTDGGSTWKQASYAPDAEKGEAAFAASGTCLRAEKGTLWIATGGAKSRLLTGGSKGWQAITLSVRQGKPSQGAFSVAIANGTQVAVGGDYEKYSETDSVACISQKGKAITATRQPAGFQSAVEYLGKQTLIATGTPGSNISTDGGKTWNKIDGISFNAVRKARHGKLVLFAGNGGKIGILKF